MEEVQRNNPYKLVKKQHYNMDFVLRKFAVEGKLEVVNKVSKEIRSLPTDNDLFIAKRVWSQECETTISHPIERRFIAQVNRILTGEPICDHKALSEYHLLWYLRHYHYQNNDPNDVQIFRKLRCGSFSKNDEEYLESIGRVPYRRGGKIASRFAVTNLIRSDLEKNQRHYVGFKWQVLHDPRGGFFCADCFGRNLSLAVSPHYLLVANKHIEKGVRVLSADEVEQMNHRTVEKCKSFYIRKPQERS
ncbi:hypothetical protein NX014_21215 [Vibrio vulnificus]|uniref:hypothetical protein n=1 Tax=Vibrio vulnificus TaxID=672 RepID=UPI0028DF4C0F|nr:hypothetical protein [Vibrio vulnificus]MDT8826777.1 hypothetical protein [Vibrio vulnificus]